MPVPYILVVDDEPKVLQKVAAALSNGGYEVATAADGEEALALAKARKPDLIVADIRMPKMDGWTLIKRLREMSAFTLVPVIFLTQLNSVKDQLRGFKLGADDYLPKPFKFNDLRLRVTAALQRRAEMEKSLKGRGSENSPGFRGRLDQVGLSSLLIVLEMEKRTGALALARLSRGETARIYLREGHVVRARVDGKPALQDAQAVYYLVGWTDGEFSFSPIPVDLDNTVNLSTMQLLIEGARLSDEHLQSEPGT